MSGMRSEETSEPRNGGPFRSPVFLPPPRPSRPPVVDVEAHDVPPPNHLRHYLRIVHKYRRLMAVCFAATLFVTLLVTLLTPRRYTATTRLQVARQSPIQLRLEDNVRRLDEPGNGPDNAALFVPTQVAALQSRDLAQRVIAGRGLAENEAFLHPSRDLVMPLSAAGGTLSALQPRGWEIAPSRPRDSAGAYVVKVDPRLLDRYMKSLSVNEVRGTDLIEVTFTTPSPALSAFLTAAHTQAFMEANDEARRATDAVASGFLERQLAESRQTVQRAEAALASFSAEHPNVAVNQEQKIVAARIGELSSLLTTAEGERTTLESRYQFLTRPKSDPLAYLLDRPGVQKLRLALLDVRSQRAGLKGRLGPNHPQMQDLAQLEGEMAQQLRTEVAQGVAAVRSHYDAAKLREAKLRRKLARLEETGIQLRTLGAHYDLLKGEVDTAHDLHESLLKQRMQTAVSAELTPPNVRVIERAEVPAKPSRPKIAVNLALGVFGGLMLAIGGAFACEYFDSSVKSSEEVEGLLRLPSLAAIPNFSLARNASDGPRALVGADDVGDELLVLHEPWSPVAEAFRNMRTAVLFSSPGSPPPKVILVTSARSAEGKTVASLNLACTLAEWGARALLVDADLRHPRCHAALGIGNDRGLSTWLSGNADLEELVTPVNGSGLFVLPAGPPPPNPAELVGSIRMHAGFMTLRERFDFVVIDTPPVLPVTDAVLLAREADGVVLVVKGHDTPRELVRQARDRLVLAGADFLGVMVNNVGLGWGDPYFYDTYGYSRYGSGARAERHS